MQKRHTKIVIERDEVVVWRRAPQPIVAWCPECQRKTQTITAMQVAESCQVDQSRIQEWIQSGRVHGRQTPEHGLVICLNSLDLPR